jgi:hypothetical protein
MRVWRTNKITISLTAQINVICIPAITGDEAHVFLSKDRLANTLLDHDLVPHLFGCGLNGSNNVVVTRTTTNITLEPFPDNLFIDGRLSMNQVYCRHNHAGCAKTALQTMALAKRFLHWMQVIWVAQAFNGSHFGPFALRSKNRTRLNRPAVKMNRAGSALGGITADVGAGQFQPTPNQIHKRGVSWTVQRYRLAIDI